MALALQLGEHGTPPERLRVTATVTLEEVDGRPTITTSALQVRATVPGIGADDFATVVDAAAELCPVSRLYAGARISIDAELEQA